MDVRSSGCVLLEPEEEAGIPICGGNLSTPVIDTSSYVEENQYQIGNTLYMEMQTSRIPNE